MLKFCYVNYAIRNTIGESMLWQSENLKLNGVLILYPIGYKTVFRKRLRKDCIKNRNLLFHF